MLGTLTKPRPVLFERGVNQLAKAQPKAGQRVGVSLLSTIGADFYKARPSRWQYSLGLNFNGLETSTGFYLGPRRKVRLDPLGFRLYRIRTEQYALNEDLGGGMIKRASASALLHARMSFVIVRDALGGLELGAGAFMDWMFTSKPRPGDESPAKRNLIGMRYGPEVSLTVVLLRHIYLDGQLGVYVDGCKQTPAPAHCLVNSGYRPTDGRPANLTLTAPVRFSLGLGWRWTF